MPSTMPDSSLSSHTAGRTMTRSHSIDASSSASVTDPQDMVHDLKAELAELRGQYEQAKDTLNCIFSSHPDMLLVSAVTGEILRGNDQQSLSERPTLFSAWRSQIDRIEQRREQEEEEDPVKTHEDKKQVHDFVLGPKNKPYLNEASLSVRVANYSSHSGQPRQLLVQWSGGSDDVSSGATGLTKNRSISDLHQMELALSESEERHFNLFNTTTQGVVYQAHDGQIMAANPSAERILGLTVDQMMGRTSVDPRWRSIREDGSDFPGEQHPSMVALQSGKPVLGVVMGIFHPSDEAYHWLVVDSVPRFRKEDLSKGTPENPAKPYQVYSTFTDITDRKLYEKEILKAKQRAEEGDRLKSAFLANMSHEIRTPLNGILGHLELCLSNDLAADCRDENREGLQVAMASGRLLVSIIQDILDLSKIEAGQMDVGCDPFSLRPIVQQVQRIGQMLVQQRNKADKLQVRCEFHSTAEFGEIAPFVYGDFFRLQQVLNNLVSNAVKFTEKGTVEIHVFLTKNPKTQSAEEKQEDTEKAEQECVAQDLIFPPTEHMLLFEIRDTGKGITPHHCTVIFEPFRQVDFGDTRKHGGTGLGLTISKKLVQLMGGDLTVTSTVNVGSTFSFTLPYRVASEASVNSDSISCLAAAFDGSTILLNNNSTTPIASSNKGGNKNNITGRILLAEDDPVSRKIANRMLEKAGCDVVLAQDGLQAVKQFENNGPFDCIFMDVHMPTMGGLEATQRIRGLEAAQRQQGSEVKSTTIIALSAGAMKGDKEDGLAAGMTDYLTKPVNYRELLLTLRRYLRD